MRLGHTTVMPSLREKVVKGYIWGYRLPAPRYTISRTPLWISDLLSAPHWTRTNNPLIKSHLPTPKKPEENVPCPPMGPLLGPVDPNPCRPDSDLQSVIDAWPNLPPTIRAGILAIIAATKCDR